MALDQKELTKPLSKLRKLLRKMPKQPTPEQIHDFRTNIRHVEASVKALQLDRRSAGKRVLEPLTPLRKRAGRIRDMDVLTAFATSLSRDGTQEAVVQVLEHLGQKRQRAAVKLQKCLNKHRRTANKRLKRCASIINRNLSGPGNARASEWRANATADVLLLSGEIASWQRLTSKNLHPFRLKVKELRNVLQIAGDDGELGKRLRDVKDAIGEWHDWTVLSSITKDRLPKPDRNSLVPRIDAIARDKEERALKLSNRLRKQYFDRLPKNRRKGIPEPVLKSAAQLAA